MRQIHLPHCRMVKVDIQILRGQGDEPRNDNPLRRDMKNPLTARNSISEQQKCEPVPFQRTADRALSIAAPNHRIAEGLEPKSTPAAKRAVPLLSDEACGA